MISQRRIATGTAAAAFVLAFALPAFAAWGVDPVTVTSATASIPLVEGCSDGAQGSFVAWQEGSALRAQHLKPNGDLDPAWPAAGAVASNVVAARSELVALPDRLGGLYLVSKEGATLYATRLGPGGAVAAGWPAGGRSLVAQFPIASGVYEEHTESFGTWYGDVGLARIDDGGAVFFWSQEEGRVGLFAVRVNAAGAVTGVDASAKAVLDLSRLRFVRGAGVRATISMPGPGSGRFELFDLAGRRLASQAIEPGAREVTIAGTAALPSGLYFGRLSAGERGALAKLIVAR